MQNRHILLSDTELRTVRPQDIPAGFEYDTRQGAWFSMSDNTLLIDHAGFAAVASKKKDIETGEDQK